MEPSLKVTVPGGVPAPGELTVTVAVKTMAWPNTDGAEEELTEVVVPALLTTWLRALAVELELKVVSAPYSTVIEWVATDKLFAAKVAWPPAKETLPSVVVPFLKATDPVGVPVAGETALTVAVNVTDCPTTVGLVGEAETVTELFSLFTTNEASELVTLPPAVSLTITV